MTACIVVGRAVVELAAAAARPQPWASWRRTGSAATGRYHHGFTQAFKQPLEPDHPTLLRAHTLLYTANVRAQCVASGLRVAAQLVAKSLHVAAQIVAQGTRFPGDLPPQVDEDGAQCGQHERCEPYPDRQDADQFGAHVRASDRFITASPVLTSSAQPSTWRCTRVYRLEYRNVRCASRFGRVNARRAGDPFRRAGGGVGCAADEAGRRCDVRCCATRAPLKEFVDQSFARFVTGDLDVNSDADWNNYLAQLEALKVDRFVEILQIACDRMYR